MAGGRLLVPAPPGGLVEQHGSDGSTGSAVSSASRTGCGEGGNAVAFTVTAPRRSSVMRTLAARSRHDASSVSSAVAMRASSNREPEVARRAAQPGEVALEVEEPAVGIVPQGFVEIEPRPSRREHPRLGDDLVVLARRA